MKNKFLFVYPDIGTSTANFSPAIQLLSAILKDKGLDVSLVHINDAFVPDDNDAILASIKSYNPDVIGFTATSFQYPRANEIAGFIQREYPGRLVILGGVHATIKPDDLKESNFDAFCIGEGDEALPELLESISNRHDYFHVKNFHIKLPNSHIQKNPIRPFVKDLNTLPFWDMDIMDMPKLLKIRNEWLSISFSRGCPYKCSFCINPLLLEINVTGKSQLKGYCRKRSVNNVVSELVSIIGRFPDIKVINFDDDLLMLDKTWVIEFCKKYKSAIFDKYGIHYAFNCRANTIDDEVALALSQSGCFELRIGFETGDESLRNMMLNKQVTNKELVRAFGIADHYGIRTNAFTMLGIPGETGESIIDTLKMIATLKPFLIRMTFLYPYYNTQIYNYCIENDLIKPEFKQLLNSFTESPLMFDNINNAQLLRCRLLFPWYVNLLLCKDFSKSILYSLKIRKYSKMSFDQLRNPYTLSNIIQEDRELSDTLTAQEVPHYKYFDKNPNYFHLKGKYGFA